MGGRFGSCPAIQKAAEWASVGDARRLRNELETIATDWRGVLANDPEHARPIVSQLLVGRVRFRPLERGRWEMTGEGTLAGLLTRDVFRSVWRPERIGTFFRGGQRKRVGVPKGIAPFSVSGSVVRKVA